MDCAIIRDAMVVNYVPWKPGTEEEFGEVRGALEDILQSPQFRNSKRYPALLSYLVEEVLAGRTEIKERTLGIEVFGRPADYDTNTDTAVRYSAGEVRKRLALYYHSHPDSKVQISLTTRSYVPEFLLLTEDPVHEGHPHTVPLLAPTGADSFRYWKPLALILASVLALVGVAGLVYPIWRNWLPDPVRAFWKPFIAPDVTALICPGGNVLEANRTVPIQPADGRTPTPYLSVGNGLAMGRVAAGISSLGGRYHIQPASTVTLSQLSEGPVILIAAYNNSWTERLLLPLRFHFSPSPQKGIVDASNPQHAWVRSDADEENSPDYALIARFHSSSTGHMVVVAAGLKRFGTDAASQFVSSAEDLKQLDDRLGRGWEKRNIEVVLKVDVAQGRVGAPQIMDAYAW
ncbi:MAG: hypothetical protein V4734_05095 [Terriglobus sp.]